MADSRLSAAEPDIPDYERADPTESPDENWHPDYVKGQILDREEELHLQIFWLRFMRLWLTLGNALLFGIGISSLILDRPGGARLTQALLGAAAISLLLASFASYRQYKRVRQARLKIRKLNVIYRQILLDQNPQGDKESPDAVLVHQKRYREDMPDLISQFREEANRNRRTHNRWQTVIIVGSVGASAVTTASVFYSATRWVSVGITALVGLAAGFTGYFKYHERSFNLQQTADSIEREYEAVDLRVGRYRGLDEKDAFSAFADTVERLRDEQSKRQQQLDQPVEIKREE